MWMPVKRYDIIQWFIDYLGAKTYLEIGIRYGETFNVIQCEKKIGVDLSIPEEMNMKGILHRMSSDEYFENHAQKFDVAFIDGNHTFEQSLRDAENCLRYMNPNGAIILHDCNPTKLEQATPEYIGASPDWCGEVWKTIVTLRTRPELSVLVFDVDYGVGMVMRKGQETLNFSHEEIESMTYKDLSRNRKKFLNLIECDDE